MIWNIPNVIWQALTRTFFIPTIRSFAFDAVALFISVLDNWCTRVLQSRSVPDGLLEFRPSKQISQTRLEIIRLSLIRCGSSLAPFGHQYHVLGQLVLC